MDSAKDQIKRKIIVWEHIVHWLNNSLHKFVITTEAKLFVLY